VPGFASDQLRLSLTLLSTPSRLTWIMGDAMGRSVPRRLIYGFAAPVCDSYNDDHDTTDKHRSNLVKSGIADRCCHPVNHKSSFFVSRKQFHVSAEGSTPNLRSSGNQDHHLTQCVVGPHKRFCQMASKSVERFKQGHECDRRQTDDRPCYGEMCRNTRNR